MKYTLQRVRLNQGGYDSCGSYWGVGQALFWFCSDDFSIENVIRARDRAHAKEQIRKLDKEARFYR